MRNFKLWLGQIVILLLSAAWKEDRDENNLWQNLWEN